MDQSRWHESFHMMGDHLWGHFPGWRVATEACRPPWLLLYFRSDFPDSFLEPSECFHLTTVFNLEDSRVSFGEEGGARLIIGCCGINMLAFRRCAASVAFEHKDNESTWANKRSVTTLLMVLPVCTRRAIIIFIFVFRKCADPSGVLKARIIQNEMCERKWSYHGEDAADVLCTCMAV